MIYIYKLCDLHAIFLFQIISFKKYFYVSLGDNFLLFLWRPRSCGGPWATAQFVSPPLNLALRVICLNSDI